MNSPREEGELSDDDLDIYVVAERPSPSALKAINGQKDGDRKVVQNDRRKKTARKPYYSYKDHDRVVSKDPPSNLTASAEESKHRRSSGSKVWSRLQDHHEHQKNLRYSPWSTRTDKQYHHPPDSRTRNPPPPLAKPSLPPPKPLFPHGIPLIPPNPPLPPYFAPETEPAPPPPPKLPFNPSQVRSKRRKNATKHRPSHIDVPKSPPTDLNETDYADLLLEYKQIQDQLKDIQEEEASAQEKLPKESFKNEKEDSKPKEDAFDLDLLHLKWAALATTVKPKKAEEKVFTEAEQKEAARNFMAQLGSDLQFPVSQDNYEEVSMDIASDTESSDLFSSAVQVEEKIPGILDDVFAEKPLFDDNSNTASPIPSVYDDDLSKYSSLTSVAPGDIKIPGIDVDPLETEPSDNITCSSQTEDDNGEENEALLRAKLLASLQRRKEAARKLQEESKVISAASSPQVMSPADPTAVSSPSQTGSPAPVNQKPQTQTSKRSIGLPQSSSANDLQKLKGRKSPTPAEQVPLPLHAPLMIDLQEDSSDDEAGSKPPSNLFGSIDTFLREAKVASVTEPNEKNGAVGDQRAITCVSKETENQRAVVTKKDGDIAVRVTVVADDYEPKQTQEKAKAQKQAKVRSLEDQLLQKRKSFRGDTQKLNLLMTHMTENKKRLNEGLQKVKKLRDQLRASASIYKANKRVYEELSSKATELKARVDAGKTQLDASENQLLQIGTQFFGHKYKLRLQKITSAENSCNDAKPKSKLELSKTKTSELAQEKQRQLQKRLNDLEKKIREMKESAKSAANIRAESPKLQLQNKPEHVETEETMSFSPTTEKAAKELGDFIPPRRKSLIDLNTSTVPDLPMTDDTSSQPQKETLSQKDTQNDDITLPSSPRKKSLIETLKRKYLSIVPTSSDFALKLTPISKGSLSITYPNNQSPSPSTSSSYRPYASALHCFKSYRFSPYFRTKDKMNLASLTFSNKLNHAQPICKFELNGKCLDAQCPWQHIKDLQMNGDELLKDLASYHQKFAKFETTAVLNTQIDAFVKSFARNVSVASPEKCLLMLGTINSESMRAPPHTIPKESRKWKGTPQCRSASNDLLPAISSSENWMKHGLINSDNIISDVDVRYWMNDSSVDAANMESLLEQQPQNIVIWLKLAYKKMYSADKLDTGVDSALNVLSRGLEANPKSSQMWTHYLNTYAKRKGPHEELLEMYKGALHHAPSYHLHFEFLQRTDSLLSKYSACRDIRSFLCSEHCSMDIEHKSHSMLEVLFYQVVLCVNADKPKAAQSILQKVLQSKAGHPLSILKILTPNDLSVAWIGYIHLVEFRCLPQYLFDSSNSNASRIVSKDLKPMSWQPNESVKQAESIRTLIQNAIKACEKAVSGEESCNVNSILSPVFISLVRLEKQCHRLDVAVNVCKEALKKHPTLSDVWCELSDLQPKEALDSPTILKCLPYSAELHLLLANRELNQDGFSSMALQYLELVIMNFYEVEHETDPYLLYCFHLKLPTPLSFKVPKLKSCIPSDTLDEQLPYLWLCYGLQGETEAEKDCYRTAVSSLISAKHLSIIWKQYFNLELTNARASGSNDLTPLFHLLLQCLGGLPTKFSLPFQPSLSWLDYSAHNEVIAIFLQSVPSDLYCNVFERLLPLMPHNTNLVRWALHHYIEKKDYTLARGVATLSLLEQPSCLLIHRIRLCVYQHIDNSYAQMKCLLEDALKNLPYNMSLWKDLLMLELACGSEANVKSILETCSRRDLTIRPFMATLLKPAASKA